MPESEQPPTACPDRHIRSFVQRIGRMTPAQERALTELWPIYGVDYSANTLDLDVLFERQAPRTLEIGFGDGELLTTLASRHPERDYLGIEVHSPGVGHCLLAAQTAGLTNLRVISHDAVEVLRTSLSAMTIHEVLIYFADPWPKKRHHKRRLIQESFVSLISSRLKPGGRLRLATDWEPYAEWMLDVLMASSDFRNCAADNRYVVRPEARPVTKFERRGNRLGHVVRDLEFERLADSV